MLRSDKERIVGELTDRLQATETLIVADYRGLTMKEVDALRGELLQHGAKFTIVKNSLDPACRRGRRCGHGAGDARRADCDRLPRDGRRPGRGREGSRRRRPHDEGARCARGLLEGRVMTADEVDELAKLPPLDVLRGQVLGAIAAPLYAIVGLFTAPLQNLYRLMQARIDQLGGEEARRRGGRARRRGRDLKRPPPRRASRKSRKSGGAPPPRQAAEEETDGRDDRGGRGACRVRKRGVDGRCPE